MDPGQSSKFLTGSASKAPDQNALHQRGRIVQSTFCGCGPDCRLRGERHCATRSRNRINLGFLSAGRNVQLVAAPLLQDCTRTSTRTAGYPASVNCSRPLALRNRSCCDLWFVGLSLRRTMVVASYRLVKPASDTPVRNPAIQQCICSEQRRGQCLPNRSGAPRRRRRSRRLGRPYRCLSASGESIRSSWCWTAQTASDLTARAIVSPSLNWPWPTARVSFYQPCCAADSIATEAEN